MQQSRIRNLVKSKAYRDAAAVRGEPDKLVRKRVIIAPSLTTANERDVTLPRFESTEESLVPSNKTTQQSTNQVDPSLSSYRNWIEHRKTLRKDLDRCGKTYDWFKSKPDLSELEQRVYNQLPVPAIKFKEEKHEGNGAGDEPDIPQSFHSKYPPSIRQPLPVILATISEFLAKKRLRMYDLFVLADKDKDWKVTRTEFQEAMKNAGIPIKNAEVEQLISALDQNNNDVLEYKELVHGRDLFLLNERAKKHESGHDLMIAQDFEDSSENQPRKKQSFVKRPSVPSLLGLPDISSSELSVVKNQDIDKRLKRQKKKERHRNRTKATEKTRHLCTMGESTGLMVDKFQKQKQQEYEAILKLCHLHGVQLSKKMLEKVLLHPEDKPLDVCLSSLKPPKTYLLSEEEVFRSLAPAASEPDGTRRFINDKRRKSSFYAYRVYPLASSVTPKSERMNLSSGSAHISRKTDCWMTYEQYSKLTRHLDSRFEKSWKPSDDNAYWPSYVLDKVRLYLDRPRTRVRSENSMFETIHSRTIH